MPIRRSPWTTRTGTVTASSSGSRLGLTFPPARGRGCSGNARHSTPTAPTPNVMVLASAIVALGETLRMSTVAEGIETQDQAWLLRLAGCRTGQGYLPKI